MKHINVLYTLDHKYLHYMLTSLYSVLISNKDLNVTFHIIADGFTKEDFKLVDQVVSSFDNADVCFYDFNLIKDLIFKYHIPAWRESYVSNARLFFDECIKNVDNLLYLDSDTLVVDSLAGLGAYEGAINMVRDSMPTTYWKGLDDTLNAYYNSGVLWVNMDKWHEKGCYDKLIKTMEKKTDYQFPDQDIVNLALRNDINTLPANYDLLATDAYFGINQLLRFYKHCHISRYSKAEIKDAKENPIILHSISIYGWQGWMIDTIHPYAKYYHEYYEALGFPLEESNRHKIVNKDLYNFYIRAKFMCPDEIKKNVKKLLFK